MIALYLSQNERLRAYAREYDRLTVELESLLWDSNSTTATDGAEGRIFRPCANPPSSANQQAVDNAGVSPHYKQV